MPQMPGWREGSLTGIINSDEANGTPPDTDNGMENGTQGSMLNVAGYWTVGILKGVSMVAIPILFVSLTAGLAMKVINISQTIGGK